MAHKDVSPLYQSTALSKNQLFIYQDWSVFRVRGTDQWLQHTKAAKNPDVSLRTEIFAPILVEMLENQRTFGNQWNDNGAFAFDKKDFLIVLLNPTSQPYGTMDGPSDELRECTRSAISQRMQIQSGAIDATDVERRVSQLDDELIAWRRLFQIPNVRLVECVNWPHFEHKYLDPSKSNSDKKELNAARHTLLLAIQAQMPQLSDQVERFMFTPDEIETGVMPLYKIGFACSPPDEPGCGCPDGDFYAEYSLPGTYSEAEKEASRISYEVYSGDFCWWIVRA